MKKNDQRAKLQRMYDALKDGHKALFLEHEGLKREVSGLEAQLERETKRADEAQDQMRKANKHAVRLLRAIQRSREAERELYAACGEVGQLPDAKEAGHDTLSSLWTERLKW